MTENETKRLEKWLNELGAEGDEELDAKFKEAKNKLEEFKKRIKFHEELSGLLGKATTYVINTRESLEKITNSKPWTRRVLPYYMKWLRDIRSKIDEMELRTRTIAKADFKPSDFNVNSLFKEMDELLMQYRRVQKPKPAFRMSYQGLFAIDKMTGNRLNILEFVKNSGNGKV